MHGTPGVFMIAALLLMGHALGADAQETVDAQPALRAGFARVDVTPPIGAQIPGGFNKNISTGVRDPLWAEAAVFVNDAMALAVVGVDTLMIPDDVVADARREAERLCGIPAAHILIAASHTHSGGPAVDCLGSERDPAYCRNLAQQTAQAIAQAHAAIAPARVGWGLGHEDSVSFNRRFHMKDGSVRTHPGRMNPDIVEPEGPMDPDVAVIAVENMDGVLLGCIVNHALHATVVGGSQFSPDWPGYMRQTIRGGLGRDIGVVFLNGACGDVTQVDNRNPRAPEFGEAWGRRIGTILGAEALKVLARMEYQADIALGVTAETLQLPIRDLAESDEALVARESPESGLGASQNEAYLREAAMVRAMKAQSPTVPAEVQAIRIGNAAIVTNPAEFFCALGLAIKADSPWPLTLVAELANGYIGYVPTAEAFGGGYEVRTARSSFLDPVVGGDIVAASVRVLRHLYGQ